MKRILVSAAVLAASLAAANVYAADAMPSAATTPRTRAEVRAELAQAQRSGQLAVSYATYPSLAVVNAVPVQRNGSIVLTQQRAAEIE
jgi:Domain of unknown function (DUF4148)